MISNTMKNFKDLTNSFVLFTIFILIWGYSSPDDSVKDNTLFLENNGFKLVFNAKGLKVTNSKGEFLILNSRGIAISNLYAYNSARLYNKDGSKILVNMYEKNYPNDRGRGGEIGVYSNYQGEYNGLNLAGNIDRMFESIELLKSRKSSGNSIGRVCVDCRGSGLRKPGAYLENCTTCKGKGRIFD